MINFNILSLFPEFFENFFKVSLLKKAVEKNLISFNLINIRDFSDSKHKVVDDTPYGGGYGMVLKVEPIYKALCSLTDENAGKKILLSAKGTKLTQDKVVKLSKEKNITLICGRYEGVDERISNFIDEEISIGDYILMGGEIGACAIIESVSRLIPGVIGKEESAVEESFGSNFLEYDQYTKPREFLGYKVPDILISGNHQEIEKFRKINSINNTLNNRIDIIKNRKYPLNLEEIDIIKTFFTKQNREIYIALVHYPVYNKNQEEVATAITNLDIHDIARLGKTYEIAKYYIINPVKEQIAYAQRIINHWKKGFGYKYNQNRATALNIVDFTENFEKCVEKIRESSKRNLIVIGTSAKSSNNLITISKAQQLMEENAILLVFGTGWGLTEEILKKFDFMLEPLYGIGDFNHLSVRSAVSIILDRLIGF